MRAQLDNGSNTIATSGFGVAVGESRDGGAH